MTNHPNRSRNSATLRGHRRLESGQLVPGYLDLKRDATGWYDPGLGHYPGLPDINAVARQYRVTSDLIGVEITRIAGPDFLPADGECARIGLAIQPLD